MYTMNTMSTIPTISTITHDTSNITTNTYTDTDTPIGGYSLL